MVIDIQRISARGLQQTGVLDVPREALIEDSAYLLEPVEYDILLTREKGKIKVTGKLQTTLMLACVRCLEEYEMPIDSHFDLVLFPAIELADAESAVKPEEIEYIFYEGNKIDLEKILSEQINLSLPFNPLCRETCKGLCSNCGADLNKGDCHCDHNSSDISLFFDKIKR
ncbi:MAG: DUF177 domain-containing protein [Dehalococcoidia bacterium]|nr:MAG: DUF177 domain-containing protein [Dehalococcoidia bacterium]